MKNEDEKLEAELWETASKAEGEEKVDALIQLSYRSFHRGEHAESLALCETARDLYEALGASANSSTLAHIYTGIGYSLNRLRRHSDAAIAFDLHWCGQNYATELAAHAIATYVQMP